MQTKTVIKFAFSGLFILVLIGFLIYSTFKRTSCEDSKSTILVLVDYTDPIGSKAIAVIKNKVWNEIESAPNFTKIILKPIIDRDKVADTDSKYFCSGEKPSISSGLSGPTKEITERWEVLKNNVCGFTKYKNVDCGDPSRKNSFFEMKLPKSDSSPIMEQTIDNVREYIVGKSYWNLIIASDWRQFTPNKVNFQTNKCDSSVNFIKTLLLNPREKFFDSNGEITNLFILRSDMTQNEANCLEEVGKKFFGSLIYSGEKLPNFITVRLPITYSSDFPSK